MKPVDAKTILELDSEMKVVKLQAYPNPEQVIWQAGRNDYSEEPIHEKEVPVQSKCGEWIVNSLLSNERGHYGCYSSDTEVLTDQGWVYWPKVSENTTLAAYDIKTGVVNFEKPTAVQRWDYKGKMYHLDGQSLDFLVSPDHRMIVQTKEDQSWSDLYALPAEHVYQKPVRYTMSGNLFDSARVQIPIPIENLGFWALVGFWISNGIIYESSDTLRFCLKNEYSIKYFILLSLELGLDFRHVEGDVYEASSFFGIGDWIKTNCLTDRGDKKLPDGYLMLEKYSVDCIIEGLDLFDHDFTTSKLISDQLQALAAVNNLNISCYTEDENCILTTSDFIYSEVETCKEDWIEYSGQIHCATVSTGALIVRRNYKVAICGNCLEHPQITLSCSGFVHNVIVQARTHRIGTTWDVQSQRYTGKRIEKVANNTLLPEKVFYVRPPGYYINRQGKKYQWTEEDYVRELQLCKEAAIRYAERSSDMAEEHLRDYLPQNVRQNFVSSFNLRSVLHFLDLRAKKDAQLEIQALCEAIVPILRIWTPSVWSYYEEKRLYKARLSP